LEQNQPFCGQKQAIILKFFLIYEKKEGASTLSPIFVLDFLSKKRERGTNLAHPHSGGKKQELKT
jgi:hypothetical protein